MKKTKSDLDNRNYVACQIKKQKDRTMKRQKQKMKTKERRKSTLAQCILK